MKKTVLFSFAIVAISLASCKKDRTCTCTGTSTDVQTITSPLGTSSSTTSSPVNYTNVLAKTKMSAAKGNGECLSRTETFTEISENGGVTTKDDYTTDITCTIK